MKRLHRKTNRRRKNQVKSQKKKISRKTRGGKVSRSFKGYRGGADDPPPVAIDPLDVLIDFFDIQGGEVAGHTLEDLRIREEYIHHTLSEISLRYVNLKARRHTSGSSVSDIVTQVVSFINSYKGDLDDFKFSISKFPLYSVQRELVLLGEMPTPFNLRELYVEAAIDIVNSAMEERGVVSDFVPYIEIMKSLTLLTFTETSLSFGASSHILQTLVKRSGDVRNTLYIEPVVAHIKEVLKLYDGHPTFKDTLREAVKKVLL
jgi:hypothetical protein